MRLTSYHFYKLLLVIVLSLGHSLIFAQETYSRTYDLEVGVNNLVGTLILVEDGFLVASNHSGDTSIVSALTRFDIQGDILDQNSYSDYVINTSRTSIQTDEGFELSGHTWSLDKNSSRGLELVKFNADLEITEKIVINVEDERTTNLPGILDFNNQLKVVYGSFFNNGSGEPNSSAVFALVDKATDTIFQEIIIMGEEELRYRDFTVYDLQVTTDSQFIFIVQTRQENDSPTGTGSYFEIVKFNQDGEIINRVKSLRRGLNQALAQDKNGDVYFYEKEMPFFIDSTVNWTNGAGGIVKLNSDIDSLIWSFTINENDMILGLRGHTILGIRQTKDENFIAFGRVGFTLDSETEEIGFLCKFTKEGEMLWVREYGIPIPEEFVDLELIGVLGSARIEDCQELEDGRILCMGENAYRRPDNNAYRELWMLMLDEEGCLFPGCDATQILTHTNKVQTYNEGRIYPNPSTDILHIVEVDFDAYKIYDVMGRLLQQGGFETTIDISDLPSGMHVLQLKEDNQLKSVFKFLKQ